MKNKAHKSFLSIVLFIALASTVNSSFAQFYNGFQMEFGKNRIQHDEFDWVYYRFDKFDTYFYTGGKELAVYVAQTASNHLAKIEAMFDYSLENRVQFIIYNKQSQFRQSNLGITGESEADIGGVTRIVGSKVFVYFEGDHAQLDKQIRAGLAEVLVNEMLFGGNWKEVIKNAALLTLPEWYTKGLISYASEPWSTTMENFVKDGIISERYKKFNRLTGNEALYAGHSMWHFIVESYGNRVLSNILYMTRVSRNVESGFLFVLGNSLSSISFEWQNYYNSKFSVLEEKRMLPTDTKLQVRIKRNRVYSQLRMHPDGSKLAYVSNELGQYRVFIYDLNTRKRKRIMKVDHKLNRINDYSYPLLNWHPNGELLSIISEIKAKPYLTYYALGTKKKEVKPIFLLEKILSFDYSDDGKKMIFSATLKGQSDIYLYNVAGNTQEQLTNDVFDDLDPKFIQKSEAVIFSSNRVDDTLRIGNELDAGFKSKNKDLFIYDLKGKPKTLKRVTATSQIDETQPTAFEGDKFAYLSNENGVNNRFVAKYDSTLSHIDTVMHYRYFTVTAPQTNYKRGILEHAVSFKPKTLTEIIYNKGKYELHVAPLNSNLPDSLVGFNDPPYFKQIETPKIVTKTTKKEGISPTNNTNGKAFKKVDSTAVSKDTLGVVQEKPNVIKPRPRFQVVKISEEDSIQVKKEPVIDIDNYEFNQKNEAEPSITQDSKDFQKEESEIPPKVDSLPEFRLPNQRNYNVIFYTDYVVSQLNNNFLSQSYQRFTGGGNPIYQNAGFNGVFKVGISDLFENRRIVGGVRLSPNLTNNEYFMSYEDLTNRLDKQFIFHRMAQSVVDQFTLTKVHTNEIKYVTKYPFSEVAALKGTLNLRNDRIVRLSTDYQSLQVPNTNDYWANIKVEYVFDNTLHKGTNLFNGTRAKIFSEFYKHIENKNSHINIMGFDLRNYLKIHRDLIWANRIAASSSIGPKKLIYYLGGVDGWLWPKFDKSITVDQSQNYIFQAVASNMRGFHQNTRNGNNMLVMNSEIRLPLFKYLFNKPIKSDFIRDFQLIGFGDLGSAWNGKNPYKDNNLNTTIIYSNPFTIQLDKQKSPIVYGYGYGLRSTIWGYFVRADWAWGIDDGIILPRVFYLSLNLDF